MARGIARSPRGARHEHEGVEWEAVWQGKSEPDAEIVAGGLNADGIRARTSVSALRGPGLMMLRTFGETWTVFVPTAHAEDARRNLRHRGNGGGIVESERDFSGDRRATLKFAVLGLLAVAAFALFQELLNSL